MAIVLAFPPSLRHQRQNDISLKASPERNPCRPTMAWAMPFMYSQQKCAWYCFNDCTWVDFWVHSFFASKQLFGPVHYLVYFKGVVIFFESEPLLCLDNFIVTLPYSLAIITHNIHFSWASDQRQPLTMLQEAQTFFWNLLWTEVMATPSVSEHMRQSPVVDSGPESAALSCKPLLDFDSLPLWLASSRLTSTTESLSWSIVLPKVSASSGSVVALTGLKGILTSSDSSCSELWLATSWMDGVLWPLLTLPSLVSALASCCFDFQVCCWGAVPFLMLETKGECKEQMPNWICQLLGCLMQGGPQGGVLTLHPGLLIDTRTVVPSSSEMVMEVSVSLTEHVAVVEGNHGRSLTELAWLIWERTSLKVVSICSAILVCWSSYPWTILNCQPS